MQETPCAAALQGFLRYLHPSRAGRRRVASVEKHLCACGTALWTHIRSLVCKSKVGLRVGRGFLGGWCQAGSLPPGVGLCSPPCPSPGRLGLGCVCQSLSWEEERGEGLSDYRSLEGKERYLSAAVFPCLQLPDVVGNRPFPWEQEEPCLPPSFLGGQDTGAGGEGPAVRVLPSRHTWSG